MKNFGAIFFILFHFIATAQEPYAIELNETNSLPSNTVFNIYSDSKGFVWIAMSDGLYRYDGLKY